MTGNCVHCGNNSLSCNLRYGTEKCEGADPMASPIVAYDTGNTYTGTDTFKQCQSKFSFINENIECNDLIKC